MIETKEELFDLTDVTWFRRAKLGVFIRWTSPSEAQQFDPYQWADLLTRAGVRYAVLSAKQENGLVLFPTQFSPIAARLPGGATRDIVAEFCAAVRWQNLKVGLAFSHADYTHPDYSPIAPNGTREEMQGGRIYTRWTDGPYNTAWQQFLCFHRSQIRELCHNYAPDLLWFENDDIPGANWWDFEGLRDEIEGWCPGVLVNAHIGRYGDYINQAEDVPMTALPAPWELQVKWSQDEGGTVRRLIRLLAETIGKGGNLLLEISTEANGSLPAKIVEQLEVLGQWTHKHAEAIYTTGAGLPAGHLYGTSTFAEDGRTLYAFYFDRPGEQRDSFAVRGLPGRATRVSVVGKRRNLTFRYTGHPTPENPGVLWIDVPPSALDPYCTVLKIERDSE